MFSICLENTQISVITANYAEERNFHINAYFKIKIFKKLPSCRQPGLKTNWNWFGKLQSKKTRTLSDFSWRNFCTKRLKRDFLIMKPHISSFSCQTSSESTKRNDSMFCNLFVVLSKMLLQNFVSPKSVKDEQIVYSCSPRWENISTNVTLKDSIANVQLVNFNLSILSWICIRPHGNNLSCYVTLLCSKKSFRRK